jgi:hypothetical protein
MIEPQTISAYVDGELDAAAVDAVEGAMASDGTVGAAVERERSLRARLSACFDPVAEEPVPERLRALLEPASNVVSLLEARERRAARWGWPQGMAIAASLAIGLVLGQTAFSGGATGIATRDGIAIASGEIESALETQLASTQPSDASVRIGVSFRDGEGAACRSFTTASAAGLACKSGEDWRIAALQQAGGAPRGDYRQAGSGEAAILAQAQAMMAGEPLDAAAERSARDKGWPLKR